MLAGDEQFSFWGNQKINSHDVQFIVQRQEASIELTLLNNRFINVEIL